MQTPAPAPDTPCHDASVVRQKFDARQAEGRFVIPVKRAQIIAGPVIELHPLAVPARYNRKAVVFDFVPPIARRKGAVMPALGDAFGTSRIDAGVRQLADPLIVRRPF